MTGAGDELSPAAQRKREQREREAAMGIHRHEIKLSTTEQDMARFACLVRGGLHAPYELNEYLATLVRKDYARLLEQLADLQGMTCEQCHKPLPLGCQGDHQGYATCWFVRGPRSLLL
jgi:hypothetical protein